MVRLIDNAKQAPRFWSVRLSACAAVMLAFAEFAPHALHSVWALLPLAVQTSLPDGFLRYMGIGLIVAGMIARVIKQEALKRD